MDRSWSRLSDEELLDWRICDLKLEIESTSLTGYRDKLYSELAAKNIAIRPHIWLSDDWFSPDEVPGIAIPFFLAHPRLAKLEKKMKWEVEGGNRKWCLQILRHEAGHAVDTAYGLHRKKAYRQAFGNYFRRYPEFYSANPRSKDFVHHLDPWYAQSHPSEDFAETFAVWLTPKSRWKEQYLGWNALEKLHCVDSLMREISFKKPARTSRRKVDPVHRLSTTLREHYADQLDRYELDNPSIFDSELKRVFATCSNNRRRRSASAFLEKHRLEFIHSTTLATGEIKYNVHQVIRELIARCKALGLSVVGNEIELKEAVKNMLLTGTTQFLDQNHRLAL